MNQPSRMMQFAVWGGLAAVALGLLVAVALVKPHKASALPILASMTPFTLTNQDNKVTTLDDFRGKVWIADAIFTRCPSQCLLMSQHMKEIQQGLPADASIKLVSFSTDPEFDQPNILKKYAAQFSAKDDVWTFLTGDKKAVRDAEIDGLKLAVVDKPKDQRDSANDLFIHSEKFVLIDKNGQIRGWYDGEKPATVGDVIDAARQLASE